MARRSVLLRARPDLSLPADDGALRQRSGRLHQHPAAVGNVEADAAAVESGDERSGHADHAVGASGARGVALAALPDLERAGRLRLSIARQRPELRDVAAAPARAAVAARL